MTKNMLSQYGWVIILILILLVLISLATPFGEHISESVTEIGTSFINLTYDTLNIARPLPDGTDYFVVDNYGVLSFAPMYAKNSAESDLLNDARNSGFPNISSFIDAVLYALLVDNSYLELYNSETFYTLIKPTINDKSFNTAMIAALKDALDFDDFEEEYINSEYADIISFREFFYCYWYSDFMTSYEDDAEIMAECAITEPVSIDVLNEKVRKFVELSIPATEAERKLQYVATLKSIFEDEDISDDTILKTEKAQKEFCYMHKVNYSKTKYMLSSLYTAFFNPARFTIVDLMHTTSFDDSEFYLVFDMLMKNQYNTELVFSLTVLSQGIKTSLDDMEKSYRKNRFTIPESFAIPEEINGKVVTTIPDEMFSGNEFITNVGLPSTIHSIGTRAFERCTKLEFINLNSVSYFGNCAFNECCSLREISLCSELEVIPEHCFKDCQLLNSVIIPNSVNRIECESICIYNLKTIYIPPSVEYIDSTALQGVNSKLIIYGTPGSAAEEYANLRGFAFKTA